MIKFLKIFLTICLACMLVVILMVNARVHHSPVFKIQNGDTVNTELIKQLAFLKHALENDADLNMQAIYPEGYVFINALYGLTWCNVLSGLHLNDSLRENGLAEIQKAYDKLDSETGRSNFDETLPLPYGAFYNGWSNYLLGRKLLVEDPSVRNDIEIARFKSHCDSIAIALKFETYPASYNGGAWPADVVTCVASLALHDKLFQPKYTDDIAVWIKKVKGTVDKNGLIPHSTNYRDDSIAEDARGSSQSLMLIFLHEIHPEFARSEYEIYENLFIDSHLGLSGIREYPKGTFGIGDVDSGPVILQMGGAATIVGMQTTVLYGKHAISEKLGGAIEALAFPVENQSEKFYLFGQLPMADAFIAWSRSAQQLPLTGTTFLTFHLYSLGLFIAVIAITWWLWRKKQPKIT
jgi:hypothetical protein